MRAARPALVIFAAVDAFATVMAIGHAEERVTVVTHGAPDIYPAWLAYGLWEYGLGGTPLTITLVWCAALVFAVAAAGSRWHDADRAARALLGAAGVVTALSTVHRLLTEPGRSILGGPWDDRSLSYPLWTVATLVVLLAVRRAVRREPAGTR